MTAPYGDAAVLATLALSMATLPAEPGAEGRGPRVRRHPGADCIDVVEDEAHHRVACVSDDEVQADRLAKAEGRPTKAV